MYNEVFWLNVLLNPEYKEININRILTTFDYIQVVMLQFFRMKRYSNDVKKDAKEISKGCFN